MTETARLHPEVAEFAAAVRARLSDLSPDEIEELTGDLEADLQELLDETGADLDDPAAYATELRAAAGLPPREVRDGRPWHVRVRGAIERRATRLEERLRAIPASSALLDFFVALRPVWWIVRAWVAFEIAHIWFRPFSFGEWLPQTRSGWAVLILAMVLSVQWGRGRWRDRRFVPAVVVAGSVAAVIGLPFAYDHASAQPSSSSPAREWVGPVAHHRDHGLRMNGRPVRNVFAYDAKGNPLTNVQLYNQRGKPLFVTRRQTWNWVSVSATLQTGQQAWNVYPLSRVKKGDTRYDRATDQRVPKPGVVPRVWELPMPHAPAIMATPTDDGATDKPKENDSDPKPDDEAERKNGGQ